jgi:hypothetical protein
MIGRVKPILNILDREDHRTYRAHYCGICIATKKTYGRRAAMGHSSEMVLISLLLEGLAPDEYRPGKAGCTVLPILPRKLAIGPDSHSKAIAAGVLASLQLDLQDAHDDGERRIKRFLFRKHRTMPGGIDPEHVHQAEFVQAAIAELPKDDVGEIVSGVIGSVFQLAGFDETIVSTGCRIGHTLGRLMNFSDAIEDYEADLKANRPNTLVSESSQGTRSKKNTQPGKDFHPNVEDLEDELTSIIDELESLVDQLPLRKNIELIHQIINIHARARAGKTVEQFQQRFEKADVGQKKTTSSELATASEDETSDELCEESSELTQLTPEPVS